MRGAGIEKALLVASLPTGVPTAYAVVAAGACSSHSNGQEFCVVKAVMLEAACRHSRSCSPTWWRLWRTPVSPSVAVAASGTDTVTGDVLGGHDDACPHHPHRPLRGV